MADAGAPDPCWCTRLPPLPAALPEAAARHGNARCYCPACLQALVSDSGSSSGTVTQGGAGKA
jgi:hypothetical protein